VGVVGRDAAKEQLPALLTGEHRAHARSVEHSAARDGCIGYVNIIDALTPSG
jgi:hypothetical protein